MNPVVGYPGGKRRLLKRLRPQFDPATIVRYVEPFVGMGANYLDLRARGYGGPAVLSDSNPEVVDFWRRVHDDDSLSKATDDLSAWPRTPEGYYQMVAEPVEPGAARTARFLWITNFAFGNCPPHYKPEGGWSASGTKLTSAAKWGKTFPWDDCVTRLRCVEALLNDLPCSVLEDAQASLAQTTPADVVYADPPYRNLYAYSGPGGVDYVAWVREAAGRVVLSETAELSSELPDWAVDSGDVVARVSGGVGATGKRIEYIYSREAS